MLHKIEDADHTKTTLFGVVVNALNIIGGTSFLGLPYALRQSGIVVGFLILVFMCYLTGTKELSHSKKNNNNNSCSALEFPLVSQMHHFSKMLHINCSLNVPSFILLYEIDTSIHMRISSHYHSEKLGNTFSYLAYLLYHSGHRLNI